MESYEYYLAIVKKQGPDIKEVPNDFLTEEMLLSAIQSYNPYGTPILYFLPNSLLTPSLYMAAVTKNGFSLAYIPENLQTPEVIEAALSSTEWALVYIKNTETRRKYIQSYGKISKEVQRDLENNKLL
jgi:hypothetical protein